jgi:hypothetical protein
VRLSETALTTLLDDRLAQRDEPIRARALVRLVLELGDILAERAPQGALGG